MAISRGSISKQITNSPGKRKWSDKRKRKINCRRPKGFSERAHCASKKRRSGKKLMLQGILLNVEKSVQLIMVKVKRKPWVVD
jgi:hypothetical protein